MYIRIYIYTYIHTYKHINIHTYTHTYVYTHIKTYINTYTYIRRYDEARHARVLEALVERGRERERAQREVSHNVFIVCA